MNFDIDNLRASTDIALIAAFAGYFLPYLIALIQQPTWTPQVRGLVTQVIYGVVGIFVAFWVGDLDAAITTGDVISAVIPVFLVSTMKYKFLDQPSLLAPKLEYLSSGRNFDLYEADKTRRYTKEGVDPEDVGN